MKIISIYDVKCASTNRGKHFFDAGTMRFFRSRAGNEAYHAEDSTVAYFVTSERFVSSFASGEHGTVGQFQAYSTSAQAAREAKRLASVQILVEAAK
jgi:hypothetical protein